MEIEQIKSFLSKLGLSPLETDCFLELLKKSPQKASDLALKLEKAKATVLLALYRLADDLGIIKRSQKKNAFMFWIEDVGDLLKFVERKEKETTESKQLIEQALPELRAMTNLDATKPKIIYLEGKPGLKQAFEQVLEEADEIIGYGSDEDDVKYLPEIYPSYYERRVKQKIPVKAIIPATEFNIKDTLEKEVSKLRQNRLIPKEFNYPIQVNIYKNTAVFYSFEENFALTIKSKPIAACLKKIFEVAFEKAGEYDKQIRKAI